MNFDSPPELTGEMLVLRPLQAGDFDALHAAASDPLVWAGHPAKDRHQKDVFKGFFDFILASGTTLAILDRLTGAVIGCSRYYVAPDQPDDISIGFTFLNNAYWGGSTNFELKRLMLDHAFAAVDTVWFHIAPSNIRSQKATMKLGAEHAYTARLDLSGTPTEWMCLRLSKQDWDRVRGSRATVG